MKDITKNVRPSSRRLESQLEAKCVFKSMLKGWYPIKLGRQGNPDRFFIRHGKIIFIEFKRLDGRLSKVQEKAHMLYRDIGGITVHICRSVEEFEDILNNA